MTSFARGSVSTAPRWILLFATSVMMVGLLPLLHVRPVFADTGGYLWAGAQCVDGTNCSTTYNWGYSLPCPPIDPNCRSYPYPNGTNPTAGMGDTWGYGVRNCTSYVAWKINQVFGKNISGWGDAKNWANSPHGYTFDNTPSIGDIAVWQTGGGGHGHVAYVYAVNNGIASLDEYNSGFPLDSNRHPQWGLFYSGRTTASNSAGTPYRYIHIGAIAANPLRIGALYTNGGYIAKEGSLSSGWHTESNDSATQIMQNGTLSGMVWNGELLYKQGNLDGAWNPPVTNVVAASMSDTDGTTPIRIGVLKADGSFWVREGLNGTWVNEYSGNVRAGYVSGNRIAVLLNDGTFLVKEGGLGAGWVTENGSVSQGIISGGSGGLIGVVIGGTLLVKQGGLGAGWVTEQGAVANAQLSNATNSTPARVGYIDTAGNYWTKEGISGGWVLENGSVSQAALSGNLIGVVIGGTLLVKQGGLGAGWVTENGSVSQIALWSPN